MRQAVGTVAAPRAQSLFSAHTVVTTMLCVLFAIMYLDRVNISAAAAPLKAHFNLTNTEMGLAFSAFSWSYLASVLFGGWGARKYGARVSLFVEADPAPAVADLTWSQAAPGHRTSGFIQCREGALHGVYVREGALHGHCRTGEAQPRSRARAMTRALDLVAARVVTPALHNIICR